MSPQRRLAIGMFGGMCAVLLAVGLIAQFGLGRGLLWIAGFTVFVLACLVVLAPRGRGGPRQHDVGRGYQSGPWG